MSQANVVALQEKKLVRAMRLEIAKPLDRSWDDFGTLVRAQRSVIHLLAQAAADTLTACSVVGVPATKEHVAPGAKAETADGLAYQAIVRELERIRLAAADKWKWTPERIAALSIASGNLSAISRRVAQEYRAWRSDRGAKGKPSYTRGQPIPVRGDGLELTIEGGRLILTLKMLSEGRVRIATQRTSGRNWQILRALAAEKDGYDKCDARLVYDERRSKWYAILAFSAPVPKRPDLDPQKVLVVHRGMRNALTWASTDGGLGVIEPGNKLRHQLKPLEIDQRERGQVRAHLGSGARGHGKDRRVQRVSDVSDRRARIIKTFLQQVAARTNQIASSRGCGTIGIGEYGGIAPSEDRALRRFLDRGPLFQMKQCVEWAGKRDGFSVVEIDESYVSSLCPRCGNLDTAQHNIRTNIFHCSNPACGLENDADKLSALHMLRRSGADMSVWNERQAAELALIDRVRKEESSGQSHPGEATYETEERGDSTPANARASVLLANRGPLAVSGSPGKVREAHDPPPRRSRRDDSVRKPKTWTARKARRK